jgi:hypothetical protein
MSGFADFNLGSSNQLLNAGKTKWKPENGKYRVSFVALPGIEEGKPQFEDAQGNPTNPNFKGGSTIYIDKVGTVLDKGPEFRALSKDGKAPSTKVVTTFVFWPTDSNGALDKDRFAKGDFQVLNYPMSLDKYRQLEGINVEFPLSNHDLNITVVDKQFHKMTFSPSRDSLLKIVSEKNASLFESVIAAAKPVLDARESDLANAGHLTIDQIREKLSGNIGSPVESKSNSFGSSFDADDLLDNL